MPFEWREDLSIGVSDIDNQHKELIDSLLNAMRQGKARQELGPPLHSSMIIVGCILLRKKN